MSNENEVGQKFGTRECMSEVYTEQSIISNPINISSEEAVWLLTTMHTHRLRRAVNNL